MRPGAALGFTRSAGVRVSAALVYVIIAVGLVYIVQVGMSPARARVAGAVLDQRPATAEHFPVTLTITATYVVEQWTVQIAGKDLTAARLSAQEWQGDLLLMDRTASLFIQAQPHNPLASGPCALRATLTASNRAATTQILWGEGSVAAAVSLTLSPSLTAGSIAP